MTFKELKCPNCTAAVKVNGNLATCSRCGSNFLLDIPVITQKPIQEKTSETRTSDTTLPHDVHSTKQVTESNEKTNIRLTPIAQKAINWTTVFILSILIWVARIWFGLGVLVLIVMFTPTSRYPSNASGNTVFYIITFLIMFALPSYFTIRLSTRKRDTLLVTDSVVEARQEISLPDTASPSINRQSNINTITNTSSVLEQQKITPKSTKNTKRQIKAVRIPHRLFGGANTRKIERTSSSLIQKGYILTHQNDQPARGCSGSGYTLLTFIKD